MSGKPRLRRLAFSLTVWWLLLALVLWLLGKALDQPASLAQCAASSAFFVALGEAGDWLRRRRRRAGRGAGRRRASGTETPTARP
ncbi:hypothetical protein [Streptomyces dysideae]|uniref:hypothetical protein n=1 Tax=Streptomyces dysideae TaxID=909626 RepID=UPI00082B9915|nr:hypothetical protein [Streptomyces dysideae]